MKVAHHLCFVAALLSCFAAIASGPKNIFDDDWVPPKPSDTTRQTVSPAKPPATPDPVKPAAPPATPTKDPVAPAAPEPAAARRAVPGKSEQAVARKILKEVFADQLADRTMPGRRKLTEALLAQADKSAGRPVDQFVLLAAAIDSGVEAASLPLAFTAGDRMAAAFDVDALAVKTDASIRLGNRPGAGEMAGENVAAGLELVSKLAEAEDYASAQRVCAALVPATGSNAPLREEVQRRQRDVAVAREAADRAARHVEKLRLSPYDPTANLEVGRYLCFFRGDWTSGIPELARGSDAGLKILAARELAGAQTADAQASLGDGWWEMAQRSSSGPVKGAMLAHAADWYAKAAPTLDGLAKAKVEKRIDEAAKSTALAAAKAAGASRVIDLLKLIDPAKDTVQGRFTIEKGELVNLGSGQQRIEIPYHPPEEYDFSVEFTRQKGKDCVIQILSKDKTPFIWVMQGDYTFHYLKDGSLYKNQTTVSDVKGIQTGTRYTSVVQVRKGGVKTLLDGKVIADWKTDYTNINPDVPFWALRDKSILGLGIGGAGTVFHRAELYEITGSGSKSR
jgi:hypothetical protein